MTERFLRLLVKDGHNTKDPRVRRAYGTAASVVCIVLNLLLCAGKITAGALFGFVSIMADGFNNLSDAGASLVSLVSFRIAAKPADRDHPFGHARVEYVASMIVSFLILLIGLELVGQAFDALLHPVAPSWSWLTVVVLAVSVVCKLWMALFNRKVGKLIDSDVCRATATDSLSDAIATASVLVATLLYRFLGWNIDGYMGLLVGGFIFVAGIRVLRETMNSILGEQPSAEVVEHIRAVVAGYPEAVGVHDMLVHNYGPGRLYVSLHIEVDGSRDIFEMHDCIDNIEKRLGEELGAYCTIHMDPIVTDDESVTALRRQVEEAVHAVDDRLGIHDFRVVSGPTHTNLIFDVTVPFECPMSDNAVKAAVAGQVSRLDESYCTVLTVDRV